MNGIPFSIGLQSLCGLASKMPGPLCSVFLARGMYCTSFDAIASGFHICLQKGLPKLSISEKEECGALGSGSYWHPGLLQKFSLSHSSQREISREESLLVWVVLSKGAQGRDLMHR